MVKLRVLTYNIHGLPWISCPIHSIFTWIHCQSNADVVCLQEVFTHQLEDQLVELCQRAGWNVFFADKLPCFGRRYLKFHCPSGLCILIRKSIEVLEEPIFYPFEEAKGVDNLVTKGIFCLLIKYNNKKLHIVNTHFQSDFTEIPCFRLYYPAIRQIQEMQLALLVQSMENPIICGDFNQERFMFFELFHKQFHCTFPTTGEQLDHMIIANHCKKKWLNKETVYFDNISLSDHIPVLFSFEF